MHSKQNGLDVNSACQRIWRMGDEDDYGCIQRNKIQGVGAGSSRINIAL